MAQEIREHLSQYGAIMKEILLTKGQVAFVDDEDFDLLNQWKWQARFNKGSNSYYASRYIGGRGNRKYVAMHRVVMNAADTEIVDHIHHNTLDNRKSELRIVNKSLNGINTTASNKGIYWDKQASKFKAQMKCAGKVIDLGFFDTVEEAINKRDEYSKKLFESYANYINNFSPPPLSIDMACVSRPVPHAGTSTHDKNGEKA